MSTLKILTASHVDAILVFCSLARRERLETSLEEQYNPNIGFYLHPNMVKKKFLTQKLRFFLVYASIRAAL